uniref:Uncharacterized protein n=1 Tax=Prymnesium polylepis TaxID=72548 RepID=A0A6T7YNT8_9EUKA|mmetsp:Transcript_6608/g.17291  ORF Transcript_6608/g.17291 Transcript_6608/m.17291 type:complete len:113 (-) Transcript_6608:315-653(-)
MATLARLEVSDGEAKRAYVKRRLASKLAAKGNNTLLASLAHEVQVEMERCRAVEHHMQLTRLRRDSESRLPWGLHLMRLVACISPDEWDRCVDARVRRLQPGLEAEEGACLQ